VGNVLYKPGRETTEYLFVCWALVFAVVSLFIGLAIAIRVSLWLGLVLCGGSSVVVSVAVGSYILGRSSVKIAAENNRPPPSRVL